MTVAIIAGGRHFFLYREHFTWLDGLHAALRFTEVISGHYGKADLGGERWARSRSIKVVEFPAEWETFGPVAGPLRNALMAKHAWLRKPAICVLFPGGKGTSSMREEAIRRGIRVIEWELERGAKDRAVRKPQEKVRDGILPP